MIKTCIILAGGLGTRLRTVVSELPKCMAPVAGNPFLHYVIEYFKEQGIEKFILAVGYKHEIITEYINNHYSQLNIQYSIESTALGTGGAIRLACTKSTETDVLVINGDTFFKTDVTKLGAFHLMCGADCTLALKPMQNFSRYGEVELNTDYSILYFKEKQFCENGLINGGVYALQAKKFLKEELPANFSFEKEYLEKFVNKKRFYGMVEDKYFIDIGIPEDYEKAQNELKDNK